MICFFCHKPIRGHDVPERYEWRADPETGELTIYGKGKKALRSAKGQLVRLCHNRCFHANVKAEQLKDAKAADPSAQVTETDWRHQDVLEVGDLEGYGTD